MSKSNINKSKYILILVFMMVFLTSLRLLWIIYHAPGEHPVAQNGYLDLREYILGNDQTIALDGEWVFYPEKLINPQELNSNKENSIKNITKINNKDSSLRFGTYHLKILVDENSNIDDIYSIRIPSTNTASALFVNGHFIGGSGEVATDNDHHKGKGNSYVVSFYTETNEIDIMLQVSNFDTSKGITINNPIKFGTSKAIDKEQDFTKVLLVGMVVILLLHSLYSILIYIFIHRDKIILFFAVGSLLPAIDELITYNYFTIEWLQLNYIWSFKLKALIYLGAAFFLVQMMRVLLTNFQQYKRFRLFSILYGISAILIMILPLNYMIQVNIVFFILYFISFLSVVFLALKEYFQYRYESFFIAVIVISTTSGILWGLIKAVSGMEIPFYPFDYLCAFLGFAFFWFKRFYRKNRQVVELVEELKQADKLKDEFLTSSAKKLWNPLNKMTTIAQILYDKDQNTITKKDRSDLKYLINIGRSMSFVLNDLLDFTRLKEQMIHIYPISTNIHAVISGVFDMLKYLADGKQIELTSTVPTHFPNVLADESRLFQIFFNILGNALKYTDSGKVIVHAKVLDDMAIIYVQDTGIGMDEETQENVMYAYKQGMKDDEGLGLGLNVSEKLIELHGGTFEIKSEVGKGTVFMFTLPLANEQNINNEEVKVNNMDKVVNKDEKMENKVSKKKYHILVVDDDPSNLRVISGIFSPEYYQVVTVTSGKEALKLLNAIEWDLIIIDVMMPYMSGYELTELIRERYSAIELPILLLTTRSYSEDVNIGFTLGANDYVAKPINPLELKSRSIALIDLKQSISEKHYMESAWLQAQIRPHFLFNTLNTIASLSTIDSDRMVILLKKFGEYLNGSFKEENLQRVIPIKNELELVKSYLYIESERFGDRIQVKWDVDENITTKIPPLSIQTLVENAVHHGVLKKRSNGTICIRIKDDKNCTKVTIIDDGIGMDSEQISNIFSGENKRGRGIGLLNTNRRLKRIYGTELKIKSSLNNGTTVEFIIPKDKETILHE